MKKDFEYWKNLYETDKFEFERQRLDTVYRLIGAAPPERQQALRRLQWEIEIIRQKNNPLAATKQISALMVDKVTGLVRAIASLNSAIKQAA